MPRRLLTLFFFVLASSSSPSQDLNSYREPELTAADRQHWSFQKPVRPSVPSPKAGVNPIDAFIRKSLTDRKLVPSAEADRRVLIRRVTFDLIGLPPTPEEVEAFIADRSPNAYERVVDRLLASPHFGERQAQHWLDLVRYAESNGYELDAERPHAWRYRDYVVTSFNADKPYDRFVTEQIAGDELAHGKDSIANADLLIATGFHRCGPIHVVSGNLDPDMVRQEVLTEMVTGVGSAILGLTLGCARCHDHKFDPISQGDYYRLEAFFAGTRFRDRVISTDEERAAMKEKQDAVKKEMEPIRKRIAEIDRPVKAKLLAEKTDMLDAKTKEALKTPTEKRTDEQKSLVKQAEGVLSIRWDEVLPRLAPAAKRERDELRAKLFLLESKLPRPAPQAWAVENIKNEFTPNTYVLKRGDIKRRTAKVQSEFLRVVSTTENRNGKSRSDLARWIVHSDHPLTARVMMNRLWQQHFGRGIVTTPNDFGTRGSRPSHPELLDWLAVEFQNPSDGGLSWSLKRMHRLMVLSATYRQTSETSRETQGNQAIDPDNTSYWRMNRRRLDAEALRDAILASSGSLNRKVGGPSVKVPLEPEVYDLIFTEDEPDHLWNVTPDVTEHTRRSLYLFAKRNVRYPLLEAFDQPDAINSCAVRGESLFAPQSLILMNGPFVREQAECFVRKLNPVDDREWERNLGEIYRICFGRLPSNEERRKGMEFLKSQALLIGDGKKPSKDRQRGALADFCLAIFNSSEFVYLR
ncbi:MAG: DUF1549 domain-containing protein [Gemmataceae bacterium]